MPAGGAGGGKKSQIEGDRAAAKLAAAGRVDPGATGGSGGIESTTSGNFRGATNQVQFDKDRVAYLTEQALRLGGKNGPA